MGLLLGAAAEVFRNSGKDAPVRKIAEKAGVGLGTVCRHLPQRSDLIGAVFQTQLGPHRGRFSQTQVDACAEAASAIASKYEPGEALPESH